MPRACALAALGAAAALARPLGAPFVIDHPTLGKHEVKTQKELFHFHHHSHERVPHHLYENVTKSHYLSPAITLKTGEAWFSLPDVTVMPMPHSDGDLAILAVEYDIVDSAGRSVPLSEMYSHHWLVYDKLVGSNGYNLGCGGQNTWVSNVYGAGGEMRGIKYVYSDGFGYITPGNAFWSANIHFIRTEDLSAAKFNGSHGEALKSCIECGYVPGKALECIPGLSGEGIFACCFDGCRCPVNNPKDKSTKTYYLSYNITWTTEVWKVKEQEVFVIDVFDCAIVQNLERNMKKGPTTCDDKYCVSTVTRPMTKSGAIRWGYTHQHVGALNATLAVNGKPVCVSTPVWGTDPNNAPGNEKGYAVGFNMCVDPLTGVDKTGGFVHVKQGDNLTLTSWYSVDPADTTSAPIPGGSHRGTMGLFFFTLFADDWTPPPAPAPAGSTYKCANNQCVQSPGGVSRQVCESACGPAH
eukprot:TRINITY_DN1196_c0_g1_i13.p2 TRINITY_DN1196_c0_g1~~TRINITY_DN1196_c0_g1_i13.p2  ORF type:complete len:494 (+),score=194.52 TRINITY_DN1196_c0_g1_i13:80-1483(+)